jgi:4'-phosphopantetheinyl transferase
MLNKTPIREGEVHLWYASLSTLDSHFNDLRSFLTEEELQRANRLRIPPKRKEFILGRGLLRYVLSLYAERPPAQILIEKNEAGKPYLPNSSRHFNISHSNNWWICGVTASSQLGVDIQEVYPVATPDYVGNYFLSEQEKALLSALPISSKWDLFFTLWARKEAYLKCLGTGFHVSPTLFSLASSTYRFQVTCNTTPPKGKRRLWTILDLPSPSGYKTALALEGELSQLKTIPVGRVQLSTFLQKHIQG